MFQLSGPVGAGTPPGQEIHNRLRKGRSPMSKSTILATGRVTAADIVTVTYIAPADAPPLIMLRWPDAPSVTAPHRLQSLANNVMAVLAEAVGKLATVADDER
jgi:hypothetical protein